MLRWHTNPSSLSTALTDRSFGFVTRPEEAPPQIRFGSDFVQIPNILQKRNKTGCLHDENSAVALL
ncbi:hypothetical protein MHBO_002844 [Bonamia ostreae]|uniref:Ycf15 n=1 Tax=Bonamia ostreae TaxID=126728 RepID=A0ABV2ANP9_9EUKA